jgi:hypothetical protein
MFTTLFKVETSVVKTKHMNPEQIKLMNACYHSVQDILSARLLFKRLNLKYSYRSILLLVVFGYQN